MSKPTPNKNVDISHYHKSTFMLTFAIEIVDIDVWHDCNEGWLDLGPCHQGIKIQYQLYSGQSYDLDVLIWPHVAKIWCGNQFGYVRTWQYLEKRWFTFSIRHAFPIRVLDLISHVATVTCTMGFGALSNNAKNDKNFEAYLPPVKFGERRYFGSVLEKEESFEQIMQNMIWNIIIDFIPASYLDGIFDTPCTVSDIRHQDTILFNVQENILKRTQVVEDDDLPAEPEEFFKSREKRESKVVKEKEKEKKKITEAQKEKFAISLPGDTILAGTGRIVAFKTIGGRPPDQSEVIVLLSSNNLPAEDDMPIIFVNIDTLYNLPVEEFKKTRISQLFTRWKIGDEEHDSLKQQSKSLKSVKFDDHHSVPLQFSSVSEITKSFLNNPFEIQLRGLRHPQKIFNNPTLFGNDKTDNNFGFALPFSGIKTASEEQDVLIAVAKINASTLAKETNGIVVGEFCLNPPTISTTKKSRDDKCTNDINGIKQPVEPNIVVQPSVILRTQMTLEASIGVVGCKPHILIRSFLRLYCYVCDSVAANALLQTIIEINEDTSGTKDVNNLLTGFALDTIDAAIFYVEGERDGSILKVWEFTEDYYPDMKPLFSSSDQYVDRIYEEMLSTASPFYVLKMLIPINTLLACPQVYVKPALPLPARAALLKFGRMISSKFSTAPYKSDMPTNDELKSFRLELCIPPHPDFTTQKIIKS